VVPNQEVRTIANLLVDEFICRNYLQTEDLIFYINHCTIQGQNGPENAERNEQSPQQNNRTSTKTKDCL